MTKATVLKALAFTWALLWTAVVLAAPTTLTQDMRSYDWESMGWAAGASLAGGLARTIISLASDKLAVIFVWRQLLRDAVIALVAGGLCYVAILAFQSLWPSIFTREVRMLCLVATGYSRMKWQDFAFDLARDAATNVRSRVRGGKTPPADPPSITVPLE